MAIRQSDGFGYAGQFPTAQLPNPASHPLQLCYDLTLGEYVYSDGSAWYPLSSSTPANSSTLTLTNLSAPSTQRVWDLNVDSSGNLLGRTRTDADGAGKNWLEVTRSGTALTQIDLGNGVDNPLTVIHGNLQSTQIAILSGGSVSYASSFSVATGQATDVGWWVSGASGSNWFLNTAADGYGAGRNVIVADRGAGVGITSLSFGNSSDNPNFNFLGTGAVTVSGSLAITGNVGFYGTAVAAKPTVTGSRGSNAALASLLTALAGLGLLTDSSS